MRRLKPGIITIGLLCAIFGVGFSVILAFAGWFLLDIVYGSAGNTEGTATPTQVFLSSIAGLSFWIIIGTGTIGSLWLAYWTMRRLSLLEPREDGL
jgi:hypothetical protein